jgi:hypothetical protein
MEHALVDHVVDTVKMELKCRKGWDVKSTLQNCIFGSLFLVKKKKQDGSNSDLVVKAVSKRLAETGVCTNGSKVYEDHKLEVKLLKMVRSIYFMNI